MNFNKKWIDLHIHSNASDGQYTPTQVIHMAKNNGLSTLAITDHDTTAGLDEAKEVAQALNMKFIPGIELDTKYPGIGGNFHILGYGISSKHSALKDFCEELAVERKERANRIFSYLEQYGVYLSKQRVYELAKNGIIARPHFAQAMLEEGVVSTVKEAFEYFLDTPEFQKVERTKPHPRTAIDMIVEAGGIAVLAHPCQLKQNGYVLEDLLKELKGYGLGGIECYYSTHTPEQTHEYCLLAEKLGLYVTGGSDFHGEAIKPDIKMGTGINHSLQVPTTLKILKRVSQ